MSTKKTTTRYQTLLSNGVRFFKKQYENGKKKENLTKKNSTTLRVRKLSPTLLLTKPSVPYLSCSDEKEIFKPGVAVPIIDISFEYLRHTCKIVLSQLISYSEFIARPFIGMVKKRVDIEDLCRSTKKISVPKCR